MNRLLENLSDAVFQYSQSRPDALAIVEGASRLTYRQLASLIGKAAVYLRGLGIQPRELVGVSMPADVDHVILTFALLRIGAIPVDVPSRRPSQPDPFKLFSIRRVFYGPGAGPSSASKIVHEIKTDWRNLIESQTGDYREAGSLDDTYLFSLTSGSTGAPKGIITTQRQWNERFTLGVELFPDILTPARPPNLLIIGEMSFSGIFFFLANQFCVGGTAVLIGADPDLDSIVNAINVWEDSACLVISPLCRALLEKAPNAGVLFPKMRAMFVGAAPLFPEEKRAAAKYLTPNIYEIYGTAACGFISALPPAEVVAKAESNGRISPGIVVEIVDRNDKALPLGTPGHVRCRGPGVSKGFYGADAGTAIGPEGFRDGWYYPGDIAALDGGGYIYLRGRISDIILRDGVEIFPPEIEQVLVSHPSVVEAAVLGVSVSGQDDQVFAFVVLRGDVQLEAIAEHCRTRVAAEKLPNRVFRAETLPKTGIGKLDRPALKFAVLRSLGGTSKPDRADNEGA